MPSETAFNQLRTALFSLANGGTATLTNNAVHAAGTAGELVRCVLSGEQLVSECSVAHDAALSAAAGLAALLGAGAPIQYHLIGGTHGAWRDLEPDEPKLFTLLAAVHGIRLYRHANGRPARDYADGTKRP